MRYQEPAKFCAHLPCPALFAEREVANGGISKIVCAPHAKTVDIKAHSFVSRQHFAPHCYGVIDVTTSDRVAELLN